MSDHPIRVVLPKLFLWNDALRFQQYPAALARAEPGRRYVRSEVERDLFDVATTMSYSDGSPRASCADEIVNAYGLELGGQRSRLKGIGLLERKNDRLVATPEGLRLGAMYREDPKADHWVRALASLLLLREPRTRTVIILLGQGRCLEAKLNGGAIVGPMGLSGPNSVRLGSDRCDTFSELLQANAEAALGPHWRASLSAQGLAGPIVWEDIHGSAPSTSDLSTALKKALVPMFRLGVFEGEGSEWFLSVPKLADTLGREVCDSFGFPIAAPEPEPTEDEAMRCALCELVDDEGYVTVSRLADRFGELLGASLEDRAGRLDAFVRAATYHDKLRIVAHHRGQPRMGRGLFGEEESRRVRLDLIRAMKE